MNEASSMPTSPTTKPKLTPKLQRTLLTSRFYFSNFLTVNIRPTKVSIFQFCFKIFPSTLKEKSQTLFRFKVFLAQIQELTILRSTSKLVVPGFHKEKQTSHRTVLNAICSYLFVNNFWLSVIFTCFPFHQCDAVMQQNKSWIRAKSLFL